MKLAAEPVIHDLSPHAIVHLSLRKAVQGGLGYADLVGQVDVDGLEVGGVVIIAGGGVEGVDGCGEIFGVDGGVGEDGPDGAGGGGGGGGEEGWGCGTSWKSRICGRRRGLGCLRQEWNREAGLSWDNMHSFRSASRDWPSASFQSAMMALTPWPVRSEGASPWLSGF